MTIITLHDTLHTAHYTTRFGCSRADRACRLDARLHCSVLVTIRIPLIIRLIHLVASHTHTRTHSHYPHSSISSLTTARCPLPADRPSLFPCSRVSLVRGVPHSILNACDDATYANLFFPSSRAPWPRARAFNVTLPLTLNLGLPAANA